MEAASRHDLGTVAREMLRRRAYRGLGFVRLKDYARERLGLSARTLQSAAWVATHLEPLPLVATAFDRGDLSWAHVRAICAAARPDDQELWLARARNSTVAELERAATATRRSAADSVDPDPDADDGTIDGEPAVRLRIACPARVRALWRRARELASRVAGGSLPAWRAAEVIAAEAFSGRPPDASFVDRALLASMRLARRAREPAPAADVDSSGTPAMQTASSAVALVDVDPVAPATPPQSDRDEFRAPSDPFALDARLVAAVRAIRTSEPRIGRLLRIVVNQRVYRAHGFTSLADYVRERLGISARKAWALLKVERSTRRDDDFARAYEAGAISWVQVLTLLPVVDRANAAAWLARADIVTVRRLSDEVSWVLDARDVCGAGVPLDPPPIDSVLASPLTAETVTAETATTSTARVQIRARSSREITLAQLDSARRATSEVCDVEIQVTAPASVVALVREALDVFAEPGAPRWYALERVLQHVIAYWESMPRHRDPIFARDGWRCTVPGCSSRCSLHDHHLLYRSRGGGNERTNRTAVCAAHHLHGIHTSAVRAWGTAPHDVHWHLGVRPTGPPLLAYVGDRRCAAEEREDGTEETKKTG